MKEVLDISIKKVHCAFKSSETTQSDEGMVLLRILWHYEEKAQEGG
jgi:hypothetical protein